ncbi:hypothetical protein [Wenyingzhuangia sp. IMCC45574]
MKRNLLSIVYCLLFSYISNAQYTSVINSNRPGRTETPYALGTDVLQLENSFSYKSVKTNGFNNNTLNQLLNIRYGVWKERFEVSLIHHYKNRFNTKIFTQKKGTQRFALGAKYLVFEKKDEDTPEKYKSWKKRYGFWSNGIIPSVAVAGYLNTPFSNRNFPNTGKTSFSLSLITQNNINRRLRVNNQFEFNYLGGDIPEFIYTVSSAYIIQPKLNPFVELAYKKTQEHTTINFGFGTPYLINENFLISAYMDTSFGKNILGVEIGGNISYRFDWHEDKWEYKKINEEIEKIKRAEELEKERDKEILEAEKDSTKKSIFGNFFNRKKKDKKVEKKEKKKTLNSIFNFPKKDKKAPKDEESKETSETDSLVDPKKEKKTKKKKKKKKKDKKKKSDFLTDY